MSQNKRKTYLKSTKFRSLFVSALAFYLFSILTIVIYNTLEKREKLLQHQAASVAATNILRQVEVDLLKRAQSLNRMAMRWEARQGMLQKEFELDAEALITDDPGYQAMSWTDNDYIVRWITPLLSNEKALNLDLKTIPKALDRLKVAIKSKEVSISTPIDLVQGGKGFIMTRAISVNNKINGFVQSVFRTQPWLEHVFSNNYSMLEDENFSILVSMDNNEIFRNSGWNENEYADEETTESGVYMGRQLSVKARPSQQFIDSQATNLPKLILIAGLLLSLLISNIVYLYQKANQAVKVTKKGSRQLKKEIHERKNTEALLAKERQRLSYILEGTNVGTWEWNIRTDETVLNDRVADILGYSLEDLSPPR